MEKVTTGIVELDKLLDSIHMGDNVVWEVEAGTSIDFFLRSFLNSTLKSDNDLIYVSFNKSPQSILNQIGPIKNPEGLTIIDCFTAGKGKNDPAFSRYYEIARTYPRVIKIDRPDEIGYFTDAVNRLQDDLRPGARYVFDSLTGIQDLWGNEERTFKYFTYMCPRLFDLGTVAYWILEKEAHTSPFKANLRHITQVVINLSKKREKLFIKALKLDGRLSREAFKAHEYLIGESGLSIRPDKKEQLFHFGGKVRDARSRLGMSQKELADVIGLTASFISQLENDQISPSLNSFFQICQALNIEPSTLLEAAKTGSAWHIDKASILASPTMKEDGFGIYSVFGTDAGGPGVFLVKIEPHIVTDRHLLYHRGEELAYLVRGEVSVTYEGSTRTLGRGDAARFNDGFPTRWENLSDDPAELLFFCG